MQEILTAVQKQLISVAAIAPSCGEKTSCHDKYFWHNER